MFPGQPADHRRDRPGRASRELSSGDPQRQRKRPAHLDELGGGLRFGNDTSFTYEPCDQAGGVFITEDVKLNVPSSFESFEAASGR